MQSGLNSTETKFESNSKSWNVGIIGHLCLQIGLTRRTSNLSIILMTRGNFGAWSNMPNAPHSFLMIVLQRVCSQVVEKATLVVKIGSRPFKIFFLSQRGTEWIFPTVNHQRKVWRGTFVFGPSGFSKSQDEMRSGAEKKKEACLKCSQAEEEVKAFSVTTMNEF